jgi:hypothetical protein
MILFNNFNLKNMEDLIKKWQNELILIEKRIKEGKLGLMTLYSENENYQLVQCFIEDLKDLIK